MADVTAQYIFDSAVTLMFGEEADKPDYQPFYINTLNRLLAENFDNNNALRLIAGKDELTEIPLITDINEIVNYEPRMTRQILIYGVAGYIYSDDDKGMGTEYKNKYEFERQRVLASMYEDVEDAY